MAAEQKVCILFDVNMTLLVYSGCDDDSGGLGIDWQVHLRSHAMRLLLSMLDHQRNGRCQVGFFTPWSARHAADTLRHMLLSVTGSSWHVGRRPEHLQGAHPPWNMEHVFLFDEA